MQYPCVISDSLIASLFVNCFAAPSPSLSRHVFAALCKPFKPTLILSRNLLSSPSLSHTSFFSLIPLSTRFSHSPFSPFRLSLLHPLGFLNLLLPPCRHRQLFHLGRLINLINRKHTTTTMHERVKERRRGEDGWHSGWTKSLSVCFTLWFEILNIWFTITLSGLGLSYGAAVASPFVLLFMVLKY